MIYRHEKVYCKTTSTYAYNTTAHKLHKHFKNNKTIGDGKCYFSIPSCQNGWANGNPWLGWETKKGEGEVNFGKIGVMSLLLTL